MAAKRKGKSVEWVLIRTTLLSVYISFNVVAFPPVCYMSVLHMQLEFRLENKVFTVGMSRRIQECRICSVHKAGPHF